MRMRPEHLRRTNQVNSPSTPAVAAPKQRAAAGKGTGSETKAVEHASQDAQKDSQTEKNVEQGPVRQLREATKSRERLEYIATKRPLSGHETNMQTFIDKEIARLQKLVDDAKSTEQMIKETEAELVEVEKQVSSAESDIEACREAVKNAQKKNDSLTEKQDDVQMRLDKLKARLQQEIERSKVRSSLPRSNAEGSLAPSPQQYGQMVEQMGQDQIEALFEALVTAAAKKPQFDPAAMLTKLGVAAQQAIAKNAGVAAQAGMELQHDGIGVLAQQARSSNTLSTPEHKQADSMAIDTPIVEQDGCEAASVPVGVPPLLPGAENVAQHIEATTVAGVNATVLNTTTESDVEKISAYRARVMKTMGNKCCDLFCDYELSVVDGFVDDELEAIGAAMSMMPPTAKEEVLRDEIEAYMARSKRPTVAAATISPTEPFVQPGAASEAVAVSTPGKPILLTPKRVSLALSPSKTLEQVQQGKPAELSRVATAPFRAKKAVCSEFPDETPATTRAQARGRAKEKGMEYSIDQPGGSIDLALTDRNAMRAGIGAEAC